MSGEHEKQAVDVTDIGNWTEIVVEISRENWWPVLLQVYPMIGSVLQPNYRLSMSDKCKMRYGLALRLLAQEESIPVKKLLERLKDMKLRTSVNPKLRGDKEMACLSGWFDTLDPGQWRKVCEIWRLSLSAESIQFLVDLWHRMSDLAVRALQGGLRSSGQRKQTGHQVTNMMALKELDFRSFFD